MKERVQLILLGGPGSGKGTLAHQLVEHFGYRHVSTGDLLRSEVKKGTELGKKVDEVMKKGQLVTDEIVVALLKANCDLSNATYILDGFPRNLAQAEILEREFLNGAPYKALFLDVSNTVLVQRLTARRVCGKCGAIYHMINNPPPADGICSKCGQKTIEHRKDDQEETIRERLQVFEKTMHPLKNFYAKKAHLLTLEASRSMNEVFETVITKLELRS